MTELQNNLPPGWDCKVDDISGRHYYINHYTKTTTWDDPRTRHRPFPGAQNKPFTNIQAEYIPLQHGSPELRRNYVYPSQTTPIPAFQMPSHMNLKSVPLQDMKPRMSPLNMRSSKIQDSSLTTVPDTDESVTKIAAMFPTASETHIRILLKKYMKSIFPQADETIILEILQNNDNHIQKSSDVLKELGYDRKDTVKVAQQKLEMKKKEKREEERILEKPPTPPPKIKTAEEKKKMKLNLQEKYKNVAEHLITIALESVNFDEIRANQILQIMIQEDTQTSDSKQQENVISIDVTDASKEALASEMPVSQSRQSLKSILKAEKEVDKVTFSRVIECHDDNNAGFRSPYLSSTKGPDYSQAKGTNEKLLLENYIQWQGSNKNLKQGPQGLAKGPNPNLLSNRTYKACGSNKELERGQNLASPKEAFSLS